MARALSRLCLKASTVEMSGTGAPCLIERPMPTRAKGLALLSTSLVPSSGPRAPGGITTTSKYSPAATRRASAPAVSFSIVTLLPVFFSKSGTSSCATDLKAPGGRSFRSAAEAPPRGHNRRQKTSRARMRILPPLSGDLIVDRHDQSHRVADKFRRARRRRRGAPQSVPLRLIDRRAAAALTHLDFQHPSISCHADHDDNLAFAIATGARTRVP